jgi:hypothetical protein
MARGWESPGLPGRTRAAVSTGAVSRIYICRLGSRAMTWTVATPNMWRPTKPSAFRYPGHRADADTAASRAHQLARRVARDRCSHDPPGIPCLSAELLRGTVETTDAGLPAVELGDGIGLPAGIRASGPHALTSSSIDSIPRVTWTTGPQRIEQQNGAADLRVPRR